MSPTIWTMEIPGWRPAALNTLLGNRMKSASLKKHDREIICRAVLAYGIPKATVLRSVRMTLIYTAGERTTDPDSHSKSLLDALVHSGALFNDSRHWVDYDKPRYARGDVKTTFITLQEM
jgi:hypothetical protein